VKKSIGLVFALLVILSPVAALADGPIAAANNPELPSISVGVLYTRMFMYQGSRVDPIELYEMFDGHATVASIKWIWKQDPVLDVDVLVVPWDWYFVAPWYTDHPPVRYWDEMGWENTDIAQFAPTIAEWVHDGGKLMIAQEPDLDNEYHYFWNEVLGLTGRRSMVGAGRVWYNHLPECAGDGFQWKYPTGLEMRWLFSEWKSKRVGIIGPDEMTCLPEMVYETWFDVPQDYEYIEYNDILDIGQDYEWDVVIVLDSVDQRRQRILTEALLDGQIESLAVLDYERDDGWGEFAETYGTPTEYTDHRFLVGSNERFYMSRLLHEDDLGFILEPEYEQPEIVKTYGSLPPIAGGESK